MSKESMEKYRNALAGLLRDNPVNYHGDLARAFGGVKNAVLLSQAMYWKFNPASEERDGWFYKTEADFLAETGLTRREQATARRDLQEAGVLECDRKGIPPKVYYRVLWDVLLEKMANFYDTGEQFIPKRRRGWNTTQKRNTSGKWEKAPSPLTLDERQ